jgi:hypothetical protein
MSLRIRSPPVHLELHGWSQAQSFIKEFYRQVLLQTTDDALKKR